MISSKKTPPPLGHECDRNCRPRVPPGTHRQRKGAKTPPKGVVRHSQATERGENVAQGCRPALTGNRKGHKRRPRVPPGTHRQRKGPETSPKGAARHSQATKRGENVAQGCRPALTGNGKGHKRRPRVPPSPQVTTVAGSTAYEAPDAPLTLVKICLLEKSTVRAFGGRSPCLWWRLGGSG